MEKILNNTPVRTTNNFKINNILVDIKDIIFDDFDNYSIDGVNYKSEILNDFDSRLGLKSDKYLNIDLDIQDKNEVTMNFDVNKTLVLNININAESDCNVTIIFKGNDYNITKINNTLNNSNMKLNIINLLDCNGDSFIEFTNSINDNSSLTTNFVDIGGNRKISNVLTDINNQNSSFYLNNLYYGESENIIDMNYLINLNTNNVYANIVVEGLLKDNSKKSFKGTLDFKEGSSGSKGYENENCILLSENAKSKSLPMMLCHEEDVDGSHGVSTGKIDDEKLFYLMSRGLSKEESIKLIINANINKIINNINDTELENLIIDIINKKI